MNTSPQPDFPTMNHPSAAFLSSKSMFSNAIVLLMLHVSLQQAPHLFNLNPETAVSILLMILSCVVFIGAMILPHRAPTISECDEEERRRYRIMEMVFCVTSVGGIAVKYLGATMLSEDLSFLRFILFVANIFATASLCYYVYSMVKSRTAPVKKFALGDAL